MFQIEIVATLNDAGSTFDETVSFQVDIQTQENACQPDTVSYVSGINSEIDYFIGTSGSVDLTAVFS